VSHVRLGRRRPQWNPIDATFHTVCKTSEYRRNRPENKAKSGFLTHTSARRLQIRPDGTRRAYLEIVG